MIVRGLLQGDFGLERRRRLVALPAVVEILAADGLESPRGVRRRASAAPALRGDQPVGEGGAELARDDDALRIVEEFRLLGAHGQRPEQSMNKYLTRPPSAVKREGTGVAVVVTSSLEAKLTAGNRGATEMAMLRRRLGRTGPEVGEIGLGCMGMSDFYGPAERGESLATIEAALDAGATLIDTGDFYGSGHNELLIAEALKAAPREDFVLSVKFGALRDPGGGWGGYDARPKAVKNFLAYTLKRLGMDYIDIYRPARLDPDVPIEDTVGAIGELIEAGYVRHVGLSEVGAETIRRAAAVRAIADLQIEYSLIARAIEGEILPTCRELGIGVTAYAVLGRGLISGHWSKAREERPDTRRAASRFVGAERSTTISSWSKRCARSRRRAGRASRRSPSPGCWRRAPTSFRSSARAGPRNGPSRRPPRR